MGTATEDEKALWSLKKDIGLPVRPTAGTFNTPGLVGLWYTAPYLHDGSAPTLMDVLDRTTGQMGHTAHLTVDEKEALVAYMLTL